MSLKIMVLICLISVAGIAYADIDMTLMPSIDSNNITSIINPFYTSGEIDTGFVYTPLDVVIPPASSGGGGGGDSQKTISSTAYYDVILSIDKDLYNSNDIIHSTIIIINKGYQPDRDGTLISYIKGANGYIYMNETQTFELIPPTCPVGIYNRYNDTCHLNNGSDIASLKWIGYRNVSIPAELTGPLSFIVEYNSNVQDNIITRKDFNVMGKSSAWWVFIIIGILFYTVVIRKPKKGVTK